MNISYQYTTIIQKLNGDMHFKDTGPGFLSSTTWVLMPKKHTL